MVQKKNSATYWFKRFQYACKGLDVAVKTQQNLRIHLFAAVLVIVAGFVFNVTITEWLVILLVIGGVITAELINTAIEFIVDLVSPEYHPLAGKIKDIAAGAVMLTALVALITGLLIFLPYLINAYDTYCR